MSDVKASRCFGEFQYLLVGIGVGWKAAALSGVGKLGIGWAILYAVFWPTWFGYCVAEYLLTH